jgi:hypothetical protein
MASVIGEGGDSVDCRTGNGDAARLSAQYVPQPAPDAGDTRRYRAPPGNCSLLRPLPPV